MPVKTSQDLIPIALPDAVPVFQKFTKGLFFLIIASDSPAYAKNRINLQLIAN
jgi:hypothetical protein